MLPGLRRVDLEVNHRCPPPVVERAVRLVEHNRERFAKRIRAGTRATGRLVLAPDGSDETVRLRRVLESWPDDGSTRAVLARTNRELLPAVAVALELGWPFRAPRIELPVESPLVDEALEQLAARRSGREPLLVSIGRLRTEARDGGRADLGDVLRNLLGWAARYPDATAFAGAVRETRTRLAALRRDDAILSLATAHATKGLEFDHVVVIGHGGGPLPERPVRPGRRRPGAGVGRGAPPGLRRVDPCPADPDAPVRPAGPLPVPARGVQPGRAAVWPAPLDELGHGDRLSVSMLNRRAINSYKATNERPSSEST